MKSVLVIDDSPFMRDRLKEILTEIGDYQTFDAADGAEGISKYKELKPDLVFLDINMPNLSGRDALVQIMDHDPQANIVMCSSLGAEKTVVECIEDGAIFYILKPFTRKSIEDVIEDIRTYSAEQRV